MFKIVSAPRMRSLWVNVVALTAVLMMVTAGPALAHDAAGDFEGYEIPPASTTFTNMVTFCASFNATASDPLTHVLEMNGTFHGVTGTGEAIFKRTDTYYANPEGTYNDPDCLSPGQVGPNDTTMTIEFQQYKCEGTGTYERRATSRYTLAFEGHCDDVNTTPDDAIPTKTNFEGTQLLCPPEDCSAHHPDATSVMEGQYTQTH